MKIKHLAWELNKHFLDESGNMHRIKNSCKFKTPGLLCRRIMFDENLLIGIN